MDFMLRDYLLNLLFIFLSLFLFQLWVQRKKHHTKKELRVAIFSFSAIAVFLCTSFPVKINSNYIFDLRDVALWVGGLYGGPVVSFSLFLFNVLYRSLYGGLGIITTIIGGGLIAYLTGKYSKRFYQFTMFKKIGVVMGGSALSTLLIFTLAWLHAGFMVSPHLWLEGFVIMVISAAIITFSTETVKNHLNLKEYIVHNDKWESVSQLSASISHEIRNKLTTSKGFIQYLKELEKKESNINHFDIALKELNDAEKIIQDYLSFAKPNSDHIEKLNVKNEVKHMINIIEPLSKSKQISIDLKLQSYLIKGEQSLLRQALLNIIKNCIEAMPNGGFLNINIISRDEKVIIEMIDSGIGMTSEQLERLGEPYFTTKGGSGTGLGMMVAYKVIEGMNGSIKVESEVGVGTRFQIILPKAV